MHSLRFSARDQPCQRPAFARYRPARHQMAYLRRRAARLRSWRPAHQRSRWPHCRSREAVQGPVRPFRVCLGRDCSLALWSPLSRPIRSLASRSVDQLSLFTGSQRIWLRHRPSSAQPQLPETTQPASLASGLFLRTHCRQNDRGNGAGGTARQTGWQGWPNQERPRHT
jgi:hypothetical protein